MEGLDSALIDGEARSLYLAGNLTMHGVTRQVRGAVTATISGDTITGSANTTFDMADYDITEPKVGPVLSVDFEIKLEIGLVTIRA